MKINKLFLTAAVIATSFTACSSDDDHARSIDDGAVKFNTSINGNVIQTRAENAAWEANDAIGVYMKTGTGLTNIVDNGANKKHITATTSGTFLADGESNKLFFPTDGSAVDFIAYYPYTTPLTGDIYKVNTAVQTSQPAIDLLYSDDATGKNKTNATVTLGFSHQLAKVVFTVKAGTGIADLTGLTVTIKGMKTTADFNLADGTISNQAAVADMALNVGTSGANTVAEAIVLPEAGVAGRSVVFTLPSGAFTWDVPSTNEFEAGKKHKFEVTLDANTTTPSIVNPNGTISNWGDGSDENINLNPDPTVGGDGTQTNPFSIAEALTQSGQAAQWIEGYIVDPSTVTFATTSFYLADSPTENAKANAVAVDLTGSAVEKYFNLVKNPELIGTKVKLQGDIAGVVGAIALGTIIAQEGGINSEGGGEVVEFFKETFDGPGAANKKKIADFLGFVMTDQGYTYSDPSGLADVRNTKTIPYAIWFPKPTASQFIIEGIPSGYTNMTLEYNIAPNMNNKNANLMTLKCNDGDVTIPNTVLAKQNTFETVSMTIPNGTTKIEFFNDGTDEFRINNIIIKGAK